LPTNWLNKATRRKAKSRGIIALSQGQIADEDQSLVPFCRIFQRGEIMVRWDQGGCRCQGSANENGWVQEELVKPHIDLGRLRQLAHNGIPDKEGIRATTWKVSPPMPPPPPFQTLMLLHSKLFPFCSNLSQKGTTAALNSRTVLPPVKPLRWSQCESMWSYVTVGLGKGWRKQNARKLPNLSLTFFILSFVIFSRL